MTACPNLKSSLDDFTEYQEYVQEIGSGRYLLGEWMQKNLDLIERLFENGEVYYNPEKAAKSIGFIEKYVRFVEGKAGFFKLESWQKYITACIFGIVDKDNCRVFTEVVIIIGRKQGKSAYMSALEILCAYTHTEIGMQIYNLAPKLDQADIIYSQTLRMIEENKLLSRKGKKRRNDYYLPKKHCKIAKLAFNSKKSDGFNPYLAIYDEFGAWEGQRSIDMYNVMVSAQGARREPLNIAVSTANYVDGGLYDMLWTRCTAVLEGVSEEKTLLPFLFTIDDEKKWDDVTELKKSLPNLGVSFYEKRLQDEINKAHASPEYKKEFLTKYCNIKQNRADAWLSDKWIRKSQGTEIKPEWFCGCYGVGGVDLSQTTDLTSACICIEIGDVIYVLSHFWIPADRLQELSERDNIDYAAFAQLGFLSLSGDKFVDYKDVTQWFLLMRDTYKIEIPIIGYDRYSSTYFIDEMKSNGFKCDDVNQGTNLTPVIDQFEGYLMEGRIKTGKNGLLQKHMRNAAVQVIPNDKRRKVIKQSPEKHIDGLAALLDAMTVRMKYNDAYKWVWETNQMTGGTD